MKGTKKEAPPPEEGAVGVLVPPPPPVPGGGAAGAGGGRGRAALGVGVVHYGEIEGIGQPTRPGYDGHGFAVERAGLKIRVRVHPEGDARGVGPDVVLAGQADFTGYYLGAGQSLHQHAYVFVRVYRSTVLVPQGDTQIVIVAVGAMGAVGHVACSFKYDAVAGWQRLAVQQCLHCQAQLDPVTSRPATGDDPDYDCVTGSEISVCKPERTAVNVDRPAGPDALRECLVQSETNFSSTHCTYGGEGIVHTAIREIIVGQHTCRTALTTSKDVVAPSARHRQRAGPDRRGRVVVCGGGRRLIDDRYRQDRQRGKQYNRDYPRDRITVYARGERGGTPPKTGPEMLARSGNGGVGRRLSPAGQCASWATSWLNIC